MIYIDQTHVSDVERKKFIKFNFMENFANIKFNFLSVFISDPDALKLVSKIISWIVWYYLFLSAVGTFGFDTKPVLSLLSVSGLTIGFAGKDILTNLFKGIFIIGVLNLQRCKRGWIITVNGYRGRVISIDTRFVKLQSLSNKIKRNYYDIDKDRSLMYS